MKHTAPARITPVFFAELRDIVPYDSGLLATSESSSDLRDLLVTEKTDMRAADRAELSCQLALSVQTILNPIRTSLLIGRENRHKDR
jgi:acetate kinase